MSPVIYILKCSDGTFYTGSTSNLNKRLHEHNHSSRGAKYTHARRPVTLVYQEIHPPTLSATRQREVIIKQLTRKAKLTLIKIKVA